MISLVIVCVRLRSIGYDVARLTELAAISVGASEVIAAAAHILAVIQKHWGTGRRLGITRQDEQSILDEIAKSHYALLTPYYHVSAPLTGSERRRLKRALHEARMQDVEDDDDDKDQDQDQDLVKDRD
jgi:hypothetical protein